MSSPASAPPSSGLIRSMDDVWKDINLSSLHDRSPNPAAAATGVSRGGFAGGAIFQDFLGSSFNGDPPTTTDNACTDCDHSSCSLTLSSGEGSRVKPAPQAHSHSSHPPCKVCNVIGSPVGMLMPLDSSLSSNDKKRASENNCESSDRRFKRLMKNRESAARSRARRQAYTIELENEVAKLKEENARLRRQGQQFLTSAQLPRKRTLRRNLTAPF